MYCIILSKNKISLKKVARNNNPSFNKMLLQNGEVALADSDPEILILDTIYSLQENSIVMEPLRCNSVVAVLAFQTVFYPGKQCRHQPKFILINLPN